jgi:hypothetical protein
MSLPDTCDQRHLPDSPSPGQMKQQEAAICDRLNQQDAGMNPLPCSWCVHGLLLVEVAAHALHKKNFLQLVVDYIDYITTRHASYCVQKS